MKKHRAATRDAGFRLVQAAGIGFAGVLGGWWLGDAVTDGAMMPSTPSQTSFADLSANPDALTTDPTAAVAPCRDCAASYAAAVRLRAARSKRMDAAFRELGSVDVDAPIALDPLPKPDDTYRYGGGFDRGVPLIKPSPGPRKPDDTYRYRGAFDQDVPIITPSPGPRVIPKPSRPEKSAALPPVVRQQSDSGRVNQANGVGVIAE